MPAPHFDLIVFGLGPGGEEVAERMAEAGWNVLGVEPHLVGGECPYYGCIPSKMIIRGADLLEEARRVNTYAGTADVHPDFAPVGRRIRDEATDDWNDQVAADRFTGLGGTLVRGAGRFVGRDADGTFTVAVDEQVFTAPRVVVAVGTAPAMPPIDGLAELPRGVDGSVWTNREAVQANVVPASLVVLGGGSIGVELGQGFSRYGTRVSIVEPGPRILRPEEPEAAAALVEVLRREGVEVHEGALPQRVAPGGDGVEVTLADGTVLTGEKLLVAAGRHANLDRLDLQLIGLDPQARTLDVDDRMAVGGVEGLYAVGDSTGRGAFTHVAVWQARVLIAELLGRPDQFGGYHGLAWVTFSDPEIGRVGLSEEQARERGLDVRTATATIASSTRGWIHGPGNDGLVKLVADADRGVLVGATVASPYGGEILGLLTVAVHAEVPIHTLATMHYAYPTLHRTILDAVRELDS